MNATQKYVYRVKNVSSTYENFTCLTTIESPLSNWKVNTHFFAVTGEFSNAQINYPLQTSTLINPNVALISNLLPASQVIAANVWKLRNIKIEKPCSQVESVSHGTFKLTAFSLNFST
jgi:hypothetical protein